ncbi:GerAB/ArcD/ProY family transporter [Pontibacillus salicampi]|uniref:GerAB/ArcD/ProY family transporter n=1 Tax=Pontibacillus salicampi TaxID=1449801 RepID=A0ABV6LLP3_9BACI
MNANQEKISRNQLFFVIVQTQIGVGVLSLPYDLHMEAKQDGWISLLIAGIIIQILIILFWLLSSRFPTSNYFEIIQRVLGKFLGKGLVFIYCIYFLGVILLILLLYAKIINAWLLPRTPLWITSLLMLSVSVYLAKDQLRIIARVYTFVSLLLGLLIAFLLFAIQDSQLMYIFPVGDASLQELGGGVIKASISLLGYFIILVAYPYTEGTAPQRLKTISYANLFVVLFYAFTVIVSYTYFGTKEIEYITEPVLYLLKAFEMSFITRIDMFFLSIWIVSVATSVTTYLYIAGLGLANIFNQPSHEHFTIIVGVVMFFITTGLGVKYTTIQSVNSILSNAGLVASVGVPLIILFLSFLLNKKDRQESG